jgi:hypothetical protein
MQASWLEAKNPEPKRTLPFLLCKSIRDPGVSADLARAPESPHP